MKATEKEALHHLELALIRVAMLADRHPYGSMAGNRLFSCKRQLEEGLYFLESALEILAYEEAEA